MANMSDNPLDFLDDGPGHRKPVPPPLPDSLPDSFATKRPAWHSPPLWVVVFVGGALTIVVSIYLSGQSATRDTSEKVVEPQRHGEQVRGIAKTPSQASE